MIIWGLTINGVVAGQRIFFLTWKPVSYTHLLKMALAAEGPVVLDCWIDQDLSVFPMVPAGANLDDVFDEEDMKKHE